MSQISQLNYKIIEFIVSFLFSGYLVSNTFWYQIPSMNHEEQWNLYLAKYLSIIHVYYFLRS